MTWGLLVGGMLGGGLGGLGSGYGQKKAAEAQAAASKYSTDVSAALARERLKAEAELAREQMTSEGTLASEQRALAREQLAAQTGTAEEQAAIQRERLGLETRGLEMEQAVLPIGLRKEQALADAYRQAYQQAGGQFGAGEADLASKFQQAAPELKQLEQQILTGQAKELQQGTSQLQAALAQQGVRGGQAATQLRRGVGSMTEQASQNIQNLMAQEALKRREQERMYGVGQQQALQQFLLSPESAKYAQQLTPQEKALFEQQMSKLQAI